MSVTTTKKDTLRTVMNRSSANDLPDTLLRFQLGEFFSHLLAAGAQVATANASDLATAITLVNALKVAFNTLQGFWTEKAATVTTNVCTMAAAGSQVYCVNATTGTTTGIKKLIPAGRTPATGEVSWDGNKTLTFAVADAVTAADLAYAKADGSEKISLLLSDFPVL